MGQRGTDAAREAASIILLDDNFSSVVEAIRSGRTTFENLQKAMVYTLGVHLPIVMLAFLPVVFGTPVLLTPVHIAFLELAINPSNSLVFEAEQPEDDVMRRRPFGGQIFSPQMIKLSLAQGAFIGTLLIAAYLIMLGQEESAEFAGATVFAMLVTAGVSLVLSSRRTPTRWHNCLKDPPIVTLVVLGVILAAAFIAVTLPAASAAFRFQPLLPSLALVAMGAGLLTFIPLHALRRKYMCNASGGSSY
jgi:Ca2+-transporting ATPase